MSNNNPDWLDDGSKLNSPTLKETISKYISYLPLFIISLLICVGAGLIYLYYTTPKYTITESILIKNRQASPSITNAPSNDLLTAALDGGSSMNIDNEIQLLHSISLMERVVAKNNLNISFYILNRIKKIDLYPDVPFILTAQDSTSRKKSITATLSGITKESLSVKIDAPESKPITVKWNQPFEMNGSLFTIAPGKNLLYGDKNYMVQWKPVNKTADEISGNLTVGIPDRKTTIIKLSLLTENIAKGQDILNLVVKEYNLANIEEKNTLAQNTIHFIDDRLNIVTNELSGVEGNVEGLLNSSRLIDVQTQTSQSFENTNDISKDINNLKIQQRVVDILQNYLNDPAEQNKLVPSNLGINDATLSTFITRYNELQSKRQREAPQVAPNSIILQDLDSQIANAKMSINENLVNIRKNLELQESSRLQKDQEYQGFISALPRKQRLLQDVKRKQTITEGLYLYLLQKREETAISFSSSNASTYKQIDPPKAGEIPTEPNGRVVKIIAVLLGLLLPVGWIKLREILNDKITAKNEVAAASTLPVIGEINHIASSVTKEGTILQSKVAGEQFRTLRTNISLLSKNTNQVILVTSSNDAEGKSLISTNLAAVLAITGKKVALLEFDLRNPALSGYTAGTKGITDFLNSQANALSGFYEISTEMPTLHIFPPGNIPENPGDLLLHKNIGELFSLLKKEYDHIIIDTASAGKVSDSFILAQYSDITLYIVRIKKTLKRQIVFLNDLVNREKLKNTGIIVNDI